MRNGGFVNGVTLSDTSAVSSQHTLSMFQIEVASNIRLNIMTAIFPLKRELIETGKYASH